MGDRRRGRKAGEEGRGRKKEKKRRERQAVGEGKGKREAVGEEGGRMGEEREKGE